MGGTISILKFLVEAWSLRVPAPKAFFVRILENHSFPLVVRYFWALAALADLALTALAALDALAALAFLAALAGCSQG